MTDTASEAPMFQPADTSTRVSALPSATSRRGNRDDSDGAHSRVVHASPRRVSRNVELFVLLSAGSNEAAADSSCPSGPRSPRKATYCCAPLFRAVP